MSNNRDCRLWNIDKFVCTGARYGVENVCKTEKTAPPPNRICGTEPVRVPFAVYGQSPFGTRPRALREPPTSLYRSPLPPSKVETVVSWRNRSRQLSARPVVVRRTHNSPRNRNVITLSPIADRAPQRTFVFLWPIAGLFRSRTAHRSFLAVSYARALPLSFLVCTSDHQSSTPTGKGRKAVDESGRLPPAREHAALTVGRCSSDGVRDRSAYSDYQPSAPR